VRSAQPLYLLTADALVATDDVSVRPATVAEAELVAEHSAQMILGELGYDPRASRAGFVTTIRRSIASGLWWVWIVDGVLRFQCNIGPRSASTAQLQGVWTPPALRGHGYATLALAAIARRLLRHERSLTLYVNDFNGPAIALYERLGFRRVGTFATYLFP
jgi:predicted GNAT family acetyltransferase